MRILLLSALLSALAGCAMPARRAAEAADRSYARGYQQAVQEQYWIIQNQQRLPAAPLRNPVQP